MTVNFFLFSKMDLQLYLHNCISVFFRSWILIDIKQAVLSGYTNLQLWLMGLFPCRNIYREWARTSKRDDCFCWRPFSLFQGTYGEISSRIVYAAFTTPVNSIGNLPCALIPGFYCNISSTLLPTLGRAFRPMEKFGLFFYLIWATEENCSMFICEEANAYFSRE